ncbi:polysaccharide deacetylase family protein [Deinococcus multiflagellatus]|uniref:Polysaccharide deacetylase family protein n=1 Tax=Deinococcus multiflagellatus TaxID=1656887 RepID=A0ABW1ZLA4_9DEIO
MARRWLPLLLVPLLGELWGRAAGWGALGAGDPGQPRVALTFDDGPSPRTPELLAVLARHGVRATFFVTASACAAFPAGLAALEAAGHRLEAHGRWHRHALLLPPGRSGPRCAGIPARGSRGRCCTAPYGGHSPWTRLLVRAARRQVALWDVEGRDWTAADASTLARQTLARVKPGSVILLHDGPAVTPALLDRLLAGLHERGLSAVPLHELPPSASAGGPAGNA